MCVFAMMTFIMVIMWLGVLFFPGLYEDFFLFCTEVYRLSSDHRLIEFLDILTRDIFLSMGRKVSLYYARETLDEYIKWFSIIICMSMFLFSDFLEKCYNRIWLACRVEGEFFRTVELHDDIGHAEKRCPPWSCPYLDSLYLLIGNIKKVWRKPFPVHSYYSTLRHNPYIHIPIKELIHKYNIHNTHIQVRVPLGYTRPEREYILSVEKSWNDKTKKYPHQYILYDNKWMPMKYISYLSICAGICSEK